VAKIVSIR
jgi:hypothetical protein